MDRHFKDNICNEYDTNKQLSVLSQSLMVESGNYIMALQCCLQCLLKLAARMNHIVGHKSVMHSPKYME